MILMIISVMILTVSIGMVFAFIAPDISGEAFIITLIIVALAKKFG